MSCSTSIHKIPYSSVKFRDEEEKVVEKNEESDYAFSAKRPYHLFFALGSIGNKKMQGSEAWFGKARLPDASHFNRTVRGFSHREHQCFPRNLFRRLRPVSQEDVKRYVFG